MKSLQPNVWVERFRGEEDDDDDEEETGDEVEGEVEEVVDEKDWDIRPSPKPT